MMVNNDGRKTEYGRFCNEAYVPIYSKPWWMDSICGEERWDVWLYSKGSSILAAMPYYLEERNGYRYITKAPLTQNNGIIFRDNEGSKPVTKAESQERIINAACDYIESLGIDVYEQQFQTTFENWLPFYWRGYSNLLRYTYLIEGTSDMEAIWENISSKYKNKIKKGMKTTRVMESDDPERFYQEHEKVFLRQGRQCPFSKELWMRLYTATQLHNASKSYFAVDESGNVNAVLFLVWDDRRVYQILGGYIQEYAVNQAYPALIYHGIKEAHEKGLAYDFEGSMIQPISKALRQFGGVPAPYYRIRKVFNSEILRKEYEDALIKMGRRY